MVQDVHILNGTHTNHCWGNLANAIESSEMHSVHVHYPVNPMPSSSLNYAPSTTCISSKCNEFSIMSKYNKNKPKEIVYIVTTRKDCYCNNIFTPGHYV